LIDTTTNFIFGHQYLMQHFSLYICWTV